MTLLTQKEVQDYLSIVDKVPAAERMKITALLEMDRVERCKESFIPFVKEMWPIFNLTKRALIVSDEDRRRDFYEFKIVPKVAVPVTPVTPVPPVTPDTIA